MIRSAPALLIDVRISRAALFSSTHPFAAAAFTIEYSPLTLYAASGRSKRDLAPERTSRYAHAGFTITMSAPSRMSASVSLIAPPRVAPSPWYVLLAPQDGADPPAPLNGAWE